MTATAPMPAPGIARGTARGTESMRSTACPVSSIWACDPRALHERYWASSCIQVVRPHQSAPVWPSGPALYLLLGRFDLVTLDVKSVVKAFHWSAPKLLRVRLGSGLMPGYVERVDPSGDRPRFVREYRVSAAQVGRAWFTSCPETAARWSSQRTTRDAVRAIRSRVPSQFIESVRAEGTVFDADDPESVDAWMLATLNQWDRPNAVLPGVYEHQRGVWVHEDARIDPDARVIGPAWIGAGVRVDSGDVVAGPIVLADASEDPSAAPAEVDWDIVRSRRWDLPRLGGAGTARAAAKRIFDVVFSAAVLLGTLPIYPIAMLLILLEDGRPFFFAHERQTIGGKPFPCIKFRTMVKDADRMKSQLKKENVCDGPQFFIVDDPRLLKCGKWLRRFQIDELPQFLNVLLGHMSVVGPRPSPDKENQFCPSWREARLSVRPGVTGLWQVRRTREPMTDFQEWIRYDLEYVQHQSMVSDLRIIFETMKKVFTG